MLLKYSAPSWAAFLTFMVFGVKEKSIIIFLLWAAKPVETSFYNFQALNGLIN
jgi:hypothetical protein